MVPLGEQGGEMFTEVLTRTLSCPESRQTSEFDVKLASLSWNRQSSQFSVSMTYR